MRRKIVIVAMLMLSGCAGVASTHEERQERIANWFRQWWNDDSASSSYKYESDASKAHHEQTVIHELNSWIGNEPYR
jgi:hypothetical protein